MYVLSEKWLIHLSGGYSQLVRAKHWLFILDRVIIITLYSVKFSFAEKVNLSKFHLR